MVEALKENLDYVAPMIDPAGGPSSPWRTGPTTTTWSSSGAAVPVWPQRSAPRSWGSPPRWCRAEPWSEQTVLHRWARRAILAAMITIIRDVTTRARLAELAEATFGDFVKGVVDVRRRVLALGGDLHSDEEAALLEDGSQQADLWGINLYPGETGEDWIEFDSMINVRPSQGNRSRDVEDEGLRASIREVVAGLVEDAG